MIISLYRKSSSSHPDMLMASGPSITPFTAVVWLQNIYALLNGLVHTQTHTISHLSLECYGQLICIVMHQHTPFLNQSLLSLVLVCAAGASFQKASLTKSEFTREL